MGDNESNVPSLPPSVSMAYSQCQDTRSEVHEVEVEVKLEVHDGDGDGDGDGHMAQQLHCPEKEPKADTHAKMPNVGVDEDAEARQCDDDSLMLRAAFIENLNSTPGDIPLVEFKHDGISRLTFGWAQQREEKAASTSVRVTEPPDEGTASQLGHEVQLVPDLKADGVNEAVNDDEASAVAMPAVAPDEDVDEDDVDPDYPLRSHHVRFLRNLGSPLSVPDIELFPRRLPVPLHVHVAEAQDTAVDGEASPEQHEPVHEADPVSGPAVHVPELSAVRQDLDFYFERNHDDLIEVKHLLQTLSAAVRTQPGSNT